MHYNLSIFLNYTRHNYLCELTDEYEIPLHLHEILYVEDETTIKVATANKSTPKILDLPNTLPIRNIYFELLTIIGMRTIANHKWDGIIYNQYDSNKFRSWWFDEMSQNK